MVNVQDAEHGYLLRWSPANERGAHGDRLTLLQLAGGQSHLVAEDRGGYIPGQWYRLSVVSSGHGLQVLIDGQQRLAISDASPWRGGVGLYTEGMNGAVFNNVTVYGRTLRTDILYERQQERIIQRFQENSDGMEGWAARNTWDIFPGKPDQLLYNSEVYGEQWMTLAVRPLSGRSGELMLALNGDGTTPDSGYRTVLTQADGKLTATIYCGAMLLRTKAIPPLDASADTTFRFRHNGTILCLEREGATVLDTTDAPPLATCSASYRASGCFALAHDVQVYGSHMLDYSFVEAPMDRREQGTWIQTTRWACSPQWSFLAGWSRGDAVLWYKRRIDGDQSLAAFVGPKMEYPREHDSYPRRFRDFAVSICSDGRDPRSGYAGIYGAPDSAGKVPNQRTILLRRGVEVAAVEMSVPGQDVANRHWFELELRKKGAVVEFLVGGTMVLSYTDPHPLDGGVPAIWSRDNGISIAYARLHFAGPATPRTEARVILDSPWYPEWSDLHTPMALNFPGAWSTGGKPVTLAVATRQAPPGDDKAVTVQGKRVIFTPQQPGEYWYEITASDGAAYSPAFHLFGRTFAPALGRNDAHALLLYRFHEGSGNVVHDLSKFGPPADLAIASTVDDAGASCWLPGQGFIQRGSTPLRTGHGVRKLMAIANSRACTIECWHSADTIWMDNSGDPGCLLSWEHGAAPNFAVEFNAIADTHEGNLLFVPHRTLAPSRQDVGAEHANDPNIITAPGFRTGLQYDVVTWDGITTRCYINGKLQGQQKLDWAPTRWSPDAVLLLGDHADRRHPYLGTFYLLAMHDRCFPAAEVWHDYQAGPTGREVSSQQ